MSQHAAPVGAELGNTSVTRADGAPLTAELPGNGSEAIAANLDHAADAESLNHTATEVTHGEAVHTDPTALGLNATAWVALAMLVVIALLLWKKVPRAIGSALDRKIAAIRVQLDEAAQLRAEAEALKAEYEKRTANVASETQSILDHARAEAEAIVAKAKDDAETLVQRRSRMAEDKIGAAERAAIAEVRARVATVAASAAAQLIAEKHDGNADKALIDRTIGELGQRPN